MKFNNLKIIFLLDEDGIFYDSFMYMIRDFNFVVEEFMFLVNMIVVKIILNVFLESVLLWWYFELNM